MNLMDELINGQIVTLPSYFGKLREDQINGAAIVAVVLV